MEHFDKSIAALQEQLREHEAKATDTKKLINALCAAAGRDPLYADEELNAERGIESIQPDAFYGRTVNGSAKRILEMRKAAGLGAASVREIYETLVRGGYDFQTKSEKNAMDGLRISLGKASHTFHKLPNGLYGLTSWYPNAKTGKKPRKGRKADNNNDAPKDEADAESDESGD